MCELEQIRDHDVGMKANAQLQWVFARNFDEYWKQNLLNEYEKAKQNL
jgi:hypothetical protein